MTDDELLELLKAHEWNDLEFKEALWAVPKNAYETVSAFANTSGGHLVFGVKKDGAAFEILGVIDVDKVQNEFLTSLRNPQKISVLLDVRENLYNIEEKDILLFYIPEASRTEKPVCLNGNIRDSYLRKGGADVRCSNDEIQRFLRDSAPLAYDSVAVEDIPAGTFFDEETITWYREIFQRHNPVHRSSASHLNFLLNWNFVVEQQEILKPTRSGVLLFGKERYVRLILTRPVLDYQRIDTRFELWSSDKRWHDRMVFEENILQTWRGLVAKYMRFAEHPFSIDPATLRRNDDPPDYVSFRETAINLLMHQDYGDYGRKPVIKFFTDRTIFWNPGDAFVTESELFDPTEKKVRNPMIVNAFRRIGLSDQAGTGIRLIAKNWQELGNIPPTITNNKAEKTFELILKKEQLLSEAQILFQASLGVHLSEEDASVFAYICRKKRLSLTDIKAIIGKTNQECQQTADRLTTQMLIQEIGENHFTLTEHLQTRLRATEKDSLKMPTPHPGKHVLTLTDAHYGILTLCDVPKTMQELSEMSGFEKKNVKATLITPLLEAGILKMTIPDKPRSRNQKYTLTEHGLRLIARRKNGEQ